MDSEFEPINEIAILQSNTSTKEVGGLGKNDEDSAFVVGGPGDSVQLKDPCGVLSDDRGACIVVDTRNHRLVILDSNRKSAGIVKSDRPLARPTGAFLHWESKEL